MEMGIIAKSRMGESRATIEMPEGRMTRMKNQGTPRFVVVAKNKKCHNTVLKPSVCPSQVAGIVWLALGTSQSRPSTLVVSPANSQGMSMSDSNSQNQARVV